MKEKTFNDFWEELKAESPETREFCQKIDDEIEFCEMCAGRVKALMDRDKWIDINDRLPDTDREVLVYDLHLGCFVLSCNGVEWADLPTIHPHITHWRELPKPPRMEGKLGREMREILFRGKEPQGNWVYGCSTQSANNFCISINTEDGCMFAYVKPETVGQYTGLTDKNGKKIFEGDIVTYEDAEADYEGYHDNVFVNCGEVRISAWDGIYFTNRQTVDMDDLYESDTMVDCEIIGNIHDNPELLEV